MKTLRHINTGLVLIGLAAAGSGCGGGGSGGEGTSGGETAVTETGTEVTSASGEAVSVEAHNRWTGANELFNQYETQGWNESRCEEVIEAYERTISAQRSLAEAHYMAGLTASRCGDTSEAREHYERALSVTATMCKPRVALGLMSLEAGNVAEARTAFTRAIEENPATCSSGYTNLAILQRREAAGQAGEERTATETEALNNLRRALAIDSDDMAAYNQMALLYYTRGLRNNPAAHDLAEIVCRQAQLLSDTYAPIYNTWGLIKVARGDVNGALRFFARAITLDSALYEAQMNFGQITFSFRGYADARGAFSRALELRPNSYDAALGLGAALRGLNEVEQSEAQYNRAIQLDGDRPEAYYNLGILYHEYRGGTIPELERAKQYYQQFVTKAGRAPRYAETVTQVSARCAEEAAAGRGSSSARRRRRAATCAPGRIQQIEQIIAAVREGEAMQREVEEIEAERRRQEGAAAPEGE
ncbi:MAG: tetratricopeptide repeat protein [Sandaracinaceae bacterium]|nr:tetratricopeptide repeat protein [Sandaracinaceae bacterium]MBK6810652.1 tetratricopeptide repeat protein [Sandaracinaceae bacterium]